VTFLNSFYNYIEARKKERERERGHGFFFFLSLILRELFMILYAEKEEKKYILPTLLHD
jgi:hypothetical protein